MIIFLFILGFTLFVYGIFLILRGKAIPVTIGCVLIIIGIVLLVYCGIESTKESMDACEDIGGKYVVIRSEYSVPLKQIINIYGCAK